MKIIDTAIYELGFKPTIIKKYVDDLLVVITKEEAENFLNFLNSYNTKIQFTAEFEENGKLPYLDILLHKKYNDNNIETSIYRKPTSKNRLMNFHSAHPLQQKIGMAFGLISRMLNLVSERFVKETIADIHQILYMNNYPKNIINNLISRHFEKINGTHNSEPQSRNSYKSLNYVKNMSDKIKNILQRYDEKLNIGFKVSKTVRRLTSRGSNNKSSKNQDSGVVYKFKCLDCPAEYIGQTGQKLGKRLSQHKDDIKPQNLEKNRTAASTHVLNTQHKFNYDDAIIIGREKNTKKRIILESIGINRNREEVINLRSDIDFLNPTYSAIVKYIPKNRLN